MKHKTKLSVKRFYANITQRELSEMTGVSYPTVNKDEQNGVDSVKRAKVYAEALKCSHKDIIEL